MKVWNFARDNRIVAVAEVADMDEAAVLAARWNREEARVGMRVEIIANDRIPGCATKVRAIYSAPAVRAEDAATVDPDIFY